MSSLDGLRPSLPPRVPGCPELASALGRTERSIGANVTDLKKKGLAERDKVAAEAEGEKDITYVVLTDEGKSFVPSDDE